VDVMALDADVHDAKRAVGLVVDLAPGHRERRFAEPLVHVPLAQVADGIDDPQDDMDRKPMAELRALLMRRPGTCLARTSALAASAESARPAARANGAAVTA